MSRILCSVILATALALPSVPADAGDPLDHFMAYKVKTTKKTPKFVKFGPVTLADQFGAHDYDVKKLVSLAPPAEKNGEGVSDLVTHLVEYKVKLAKGAPKFEKRKHVRIINQCHDLFVEVKKPVSVMVPTAKDLASPVSPPDPAGHAVDHFLCYQVKVQAKLADGTKQAKLAKGTQVSVEDQFQTRIYDLKKITKLCNPVAKSGSPKLLAGPDKGANAPIDPATIGSPEQHLVCYQAKLAKKAIAQDGCGAVNPRDKGIKIEPKPAKHAKRNGVYIANQFGALQVDTKKEIEFCIPSQKLVATPTPTPTPTLTAMPTATPTSTGGVPTATLTAPGGPTPTSTATPGGGCPTTLDLASRPGLDLDLGSNGRVHDLGGSFLHRLRATVSGCAGTGEPSCGVCSVGGPVPTVPLSNRRCACDTSLTCTADSDCGAECECKYYLGSAFPVATGAALCITPELSGPVTGSVDVEGGTLDLALPVSLVVGLGVSATQPCPVCAGDVTANDGVRNGTCSGGDNDGGACDEQGASPLYGQVHSLDCPPPVSFNLGALETTIPLSTAGETRMLTTSSPTCTIVPDVRCFCHTCDHADQAPCFEDAECPLTGACKGGSNKNEFCLDLTECPDQGAGTSCATKAGTCGGLRCLGGGPCTSGETCLIGPCIVPGGNPEPNACLGFDCEPDPADMASIDEGTCPAGPSLGKRCVLEPFRECAGDGDCPGDGGADTCGAAVPRPCFTDNGVIATACFGGTNALQPCDDLSDCPDQSAGTFCGGTGTIAAGGSPSTTTPVLGGVFCVPPAGTAIINANLGLPSPGRITLPVTMTLQ